MTIVEEELLEAIDCSGCQLLIIDPFQAFLPHEVHLSSVSKMRPIFTMLSNIAKTTGVAIVLVGHLNNAYSGVRALAARSFSPPITGI